MIVENNLFAKEYYGQTVLHPLGLMAIIVLGIAVLLVPRRQAVIPMMIMACFVAPAQRISIFSLNFDLLRVMVLFGTARLLMKVEWRGMVWRPLDTVWVSFCCYGAAALIFTSPDADVVKNQLGVLYDQLGMYFLYRCLIRGREDLEAITRAMIVISVPVAMAFLLERATGRNVFSVLGGVPEITLIREGRLRCQGAFAHPILAGCFWAAFVPLIALGLRKRGNVRIGAIVGLACSMAIIAACASSTPVMAVLFAMLAASFYPFRHWMRWIRWSLLATIVGLHLVMKAPVWQLIARIDVVSGSTGWHRFYLIDNAINHFDEWWLHGTSVGTAHWGYGMVDVTNWYVVQGLHGGIGLLLLFVLLLAMAYQSVGRMVRQAGHDAERRRLSWALGICLFTHTMNFIAVSYFGQINTIWYLLLATIASLSYLPATVAVNTAVPQRRRVVAAIPRGELTPVMGRDTRPGIQCP